jgi:hypothetical protein
MAVAASSLVTLTALRSYCQIPTAKTEHDTTLELIIDAVSTAFNKFLERTLALTTYTAAYIDGTGMRDLLLPHYPVKSITSLAENGATLTEGADYDYMLFSDCGLLSKSSSHGAWLKKLKSVLITYAAGYVVQDATVSTGETALPADLKLACLTQCAAEWKRWQGQDWNDMSRSFGGGSVSKNVQDNLLPSVKQTLERYKV